MMMMKVMRQLLFLEMFTCVNMMVMRIAITSTDLTKPGFDLTPLQLETGICNQIDILLLHDSLLR